MTEYSDPLMEQTLSSERVYDGAFLKVNKDRIRLPDGGESYREYIRHPGAVAIVAIQADGTLVFERQWRYPLQRAFYEIPAGKIDPGEAPLSCAKRELQEETGFVAENWQHLGTIHTCIAYTDEHIELYLATNLTQKGRNLDEGEFLELHAFSPEKLEKMVRQGEITDAKTLAALHLIQPYLKTGQK